MDRKMISSLYCQLMIRVRSIASCSDEIPEQDHTEGIFLNSCELERNCSSSNVHERALGEISLRGFEIAARESDLRTVSAADKRVDSLPYVKDCDLLLKVLRMI